MTEVLIYMYMFVTLLWYVCLFNEMKSPLYLIFFRNGGIKKNI